VGSVRFVTFGCKANQYDTQVLREALVRRGWSEVEAHDESGPELVVVNTCTVTHRADASARQVIRAVRRANPDCTLMVTGCYAELEPQILLAMPEVDGVFGNNEKRRWPAILDGLGLRGEGPLDPLHEDRGCDGLPHAAGLYFGQKTRAFLKVQDGCRLACSYCIIPTVRGPSRSVPPDVVLTAFEGLLRRGYREVVLTGVNTGDYGRDLPEPTTLADLLRRLLAVCGPNRIRLNSLEPLTVTDEIVDLLAHEARLASHLQVPLQSGSPKVLGGMRRNYRLDAYRERIETLADRVPDIALGADVIVGFPGETDADFEATFEFIRDSPLSYLHVFSWSPRRGTAAEAFDGRLHSAIVTERSRRLRELAARKGEAFRRRFIGRRLDAVILGTRGDRALTGHYIDVKLRADPSALASPPVGMVTVELVEVDNDGAMARCVGQPDWAAPA